MQRFLPKFAIVSCAALVIFLLPKTSFADFNFRFNSAGNSTVTVIQNGKILSKKTPTSSPTPPVRTRRRLPWVSPTKSPTVTPTKIPTLQPTIVSTLAPTKQVSTPIPTVAQPSSTDDKKTFIMNAINEYRKSQGLSSVSTSTETCNFAKIRAQEISTDFSHAGFRSRIDNGTLPYKSWSVVTENIAMTSDYKNVVNMWIKSSGHAENMRKDTPFVCVEYHGNYYAYEAMKP